MKIIVFLVSIISFYAQSQDIKRGDLGKGYHWCELSGKPIVEGREFKNEQCAMAICTSSQLCVCGYYNHNNLPESMNEGTIMALQQSQVMGWSYCECKNKERRLLDPSFPDTTSPTIFIPPNIAACFDNDICERMLIEYEPGFSSYDDTVSTRKEYCSVIQECTSNVFDLFNAAGNDLEMCPCNIECRKCSFPNYNVQDIGKLCEEDEDCSSCFQCCPKKKVCEIPPPAAKSMLFQHDINDNDFVEPEIGEKKRFYEYPIFGYISFVGIIVFILINNVFIGYWCCCKGHSDKNKYAKCDMI